jgi:hypothetical protein
MNLFETIRLLQNRRTERPQYSTREWVDMLMQHTGTKYDNLQVNFSWAEDQKVGRPFGGGKEPLMRTAEPGIYNGWRRDRNSPMSFWLARRAQIERGEAEDCVFFLPIVPDVENIIRHPSDVSKALRRWGEAYEQYGDDFEFVLTTEQRDGKDRGVLVLYPYNMLKVADGIDSRHGNLLSGI